VRAKVSRAANAAPVHGHALDIPSVRKRDSGIPLEPCFRDDATLTLGWPKA